MKVSFRLSKTKFIILLSLNIVLLGALAPSTVQAQDYIAVDQVEIASNSLAIKNFDRVSKSFWRGAAPSESALEELSKNGIKTIVDLRLNGSACEREKVVVEKFGMRYVHIPLGFKRPEINRVVDFLSIVNSKGNLPIFVHCRQGADRTGMLVGIYRVFVQNWTFDKAYAEMRLHHFKPWLASMRHTVAHIANNSSTRRHIHEHLSKLAETNPIQETDLNS